MTKKIIIYDFDGTLTKNPLPRLEILERCGYKNGLSDKKFLSRVAARVPFSKDLYSALYDTLLRIIANSAYPLTKETLSLGAETVEFNEGVLEFLKALNSHGIPNYILSSGLKPYIENTAVSPLVSGVFATSLNFDAEGYIQSIGPAMTDKCKIYAIKMIMNMHQIPYDNTKDIIYIGDGLTDAYAMAYVKLHGGVSICLADGNNQKDASILKAKNLVDAVVLKDFTKSSELRALIANLCDIEFKKEMIS